MAPLTWRNVGGSNFGDSVAALGMGGRFLDRGLTGLSDALGRFSEWQTEQNDRSVLAAANQIQDPTSYREALRSGSILGSIDPTQVSARTLAAVDNRSRSLLDRAAAEYTYDRTRSNDAALDSNREFLAAMADAAASGDPSRVAAVRARFPNAMASLPSEQILRIAGQTQGLESGAVGLAGQRQSQAQSGERHGWARSDRADQEAGRRAANDILAGSFSRDDAVRLLEENSNLTPGARTQAMALVNGEWGRFFSTADGAGVPVTAGRGAGGAQQGTPAGAAIAGAAGGTSALVSALPFSETRGYVANITNAARAANGGQLPTGSNAQIAEALLPHLIQQESGGRDNVTSRRGAQGRTQVMPGTSRDPGFGVRPRQNDTPQEFERVGREYLTAMLDRYNGNVELALAAYNAGPGRVDGWTQNNDSVRQAVTQAAEAARTGDEASRAIALRRSQNQASGILADYAAAVQDTGATPAEVADRLTQSAGTSGSNPRAAGSLSGIDSNIVLDEVNRLVNRGRAAGVNAAVAGAIIARNATTESAWDWNPFVRTPRRAVDTRANDAELERVMDSRTGANGTRGALESDLATARTQAAITAATQRVQTLSAEIQQLQVQAANGRPVQSAISSRLLALQAAQNSLAALTTRQGGDATLQPLSVAPVGG